MNLRFGISKIGNSQGNTIALHAKCAVVVGIGNPERFVRDVERYGLHVVRKIFLPDHFKNYAKVLENEILRGVPVVITEKDAARLDADAKKKSAPLHCRGTGGTQCRFECLFECGGRRRGEKSAIDVVNSRVTLAC